MNPKYFILLMLIIVFSSCESVHKKKNSGLNFIIFIADDISWDDFGCYGNEFVQTPNIDQLATEGMIFKNMYLTTSSCSPSRNSIITGRYPHNTGAPELHSEPPMEMKTFIKELKDNGYFTVSSGKFHLGEYARSSFDIIHENKNENCNVNIKLILHKSYEDTLNFYDNEVKIKLNKFRIETYFYNDFSSDWKYPNINWHGILK